MNGLKRDLRVAFSRHAQPIWFRVVKWIVIVVLIYRFHDAPTFWTWVGGVAVAGAGLHFFYRWKTRAWTRPWGGWNDLAAGAEKERPRSR
jgi:hypothetical protein